VIHTPERSAASRPPTTPDALRFPFRWRRSREQLIVFGIAAVVLVAGAAAAWHYAALGLALAHWDARAHLVVARRIFDSVTPGWQQVGGVWLPLPHILNAIPVQVDAWYRSGASGTAISVLSMSAGAAALASLLLRSTGSISAAGAGAILLLINPNVLYLQSTPMTEAVLFGTTLVAVAVTARWIDHGAGPAGAPGFTIIAACMTRYEAWPITAALIALAGIVLWRRGAGVWRAAAACARLAAYPAVAVALFMVNSRWTVGAWFISSGFFVAENPALGEPMLAWTQVREGLELLSGVWTIWTAYIGAVLILVAFVRTGRHANLLLVLSLFAAAALPLYAYVQGHPVRIRYSVPLVVAASVIAATGVATLPRRIRDIAALVVVLAVLSQGSPLDRSGLLIAEAQRDVDNIRARQAVTRYLQEHYDGTLIMASMGSLAHYMHDLSAAGFDLREFLHEGNGELWVFAVLFGPRGHTGWVMIEERSEGGDALFLRSEVRPSFLDGFERVAEGGGVALYRATPF
jgi:hypothetical protein